MVFLKIDINECIRATHGCNHTLGICTNNDGGYKCSCKPGYKGNGVVCTGKDGLQHFLLYK